MPAGYFDALIAFPQPPGKNTLGFAFLAGGIAAVTLPPGQRQRIGRLVGAHLKANDAADRLALVPGKRRPQKQALLPRQHLTRPAAPDHSVAAAHEETVAGAVFLVQFVSAGREIEKTEGELVAAVVDIVKNGPIALGRIFRSQNHDVGFKHNLALVVARGQMQIDNDPVARVLGIESKAGNADDLLIRPGLAELPAAVERHALADVEGDQLGLNRR